MGAAVVQENGAAAVLQREMPVTWRTALPVFLICVETVEVAPTARRGKESALGARAAIGAPDATTVTMTGTSSRPWFAPGPGRWFGPKTVTPPVRSLRSQS